MVSEIVVAHRDRLARFAFDLLEHIFKACGVKLVVDDPDSESGHAVRDDSQQLAEDLLSIVHVFSCRQYGKRKYGKKRLGSEGVNGLQGSSIVYQEHAGSEVSGIALGEAKDHGEGQIKRRKRSTTTATAKIYQETTEAGVVE